MKDIVLLMMIGIVGVSPSASVAEPTNEVERTHEKMEKIRSYHRDAQSLEQSLPIALGIVERLKNQHDYLAKEQLVVRSAELFFSFEKRCGSSKIRSKLEGRPYWYFEIEQRTFGEGGGICIFLDAITGQELASQLTE